MTDQIEEDQIPDQVEAEAEAEKPAPTYTAEDADEARTFGWKAPEEWVGEKPAGYIGDPKAYLDRLNNMKPFRAIKERMDLQQREFEERTRKLEMLTAAQVKAQKDTYERELADIKKQQRAAVELADADQYDALEARKAALQAPVAVAPAAPAPDPYVADYMAKNEWVRNPVLKDIGARLISEGGMTGKPVQDQIAYAEREIRRMYPAYFPAEAQTTQKPMTQRVDSGGLGFASKAGEFSKLPPEAKAAFARFASEGLYPNTDEGKKTYADQYNAA